MDPVHQEKGSIKETPEYLVYYPSTIEDIIETESILVSGRLDNPLLKVHGISKQAF